MVGPNYRPDNVQCLGGLRFGGRSHPDPKSHGQNESGQRRVLKVLIRVSKQI